MIDVEDDDKLRATALVLRGVDRDVRREINAQTRTTLNPVWRELVRKHARTTLDERVLVKGARIRAGNPPAAVAASSKRALPGGLVPAYQSHAVEFGAARDELVEYPRTAPSGETHMVERHTRRQLPPRYRKGRVVWRAFEEFAPRAVSLWVQTTVRTVMEAAEKASR